MLAPVQLTEDELSLIHNHYSKAGFQGIRLRAHTALLSHKGYPPRQIADVLFQSEQTVCRWVTSFHKQRISSLFPRYLDNQQAAKLTRKQKKELGQVLAKPPGHFGIPTKFWDVSSLKSYIRAEFGVEYASDESYRLLFRLHNYSFHLPDAFDRHRDEEKIKTRMAEIKEEVIPLLADPGWVVLAADECRIVWETEIRRLWLPRGKRSIIKVERERAAQSFLGLLNLKTGEEILYQLPWQNQDEVAAVLEKLVIEYPDQRLCIIWDNAGWHKGTKIREKLKTSLRSVHLINFPPYAPDHNPQEHVWKYGKDKLANHQRESLPELVQAFTTLVTGHTFNYHL